MGASQTHTKIVRIEEDRQPAPWTRENSMGWRRTKGTDKPDVLSEAAATTLGNHFPGADKGKSVEIHVASQLMRNSFLEENTLFCDSSCPDEINHDDPSEDISMLFQQLWIPGMRV